MANPLIEFDKANPTRHAGLTWVETELPPEVIAYMREAWAAGVRSTNIVKWLKSQGYDATGGRIGSYFKKCPVDE